MRKLPEWMGSTYNRMAEFPAFADECNVLDCLRDTN